MKVIKVVRAVGGAALSLLVFVALWQALTMTGWVSDVLFPTPAEVARAAKRMSDEGVLWTDIRSSLRRALVGFCIGASLGVVTGVMTARVRVLRVLLSPVFAVLRPIPAIALVPLAIVWFGIDETSKYFVISYSVLLAVWMNTHHGVEHIPTVYVRAARTLGASRARIFREVVLPAASPHIVAGLRIGAAVAFLSLVAAELTGASSGIGYRLQEARQFLATDRMFVGLVLLGVLGALLDLVFVLVSRKLLHWAKD